MFGILVPLQRCRRHIFCGGHDRDACNGGLMAARPDLGVRALADSARARPAVALARLRPQLHRCRELWLSTQTMSAAYRYTAWFTVQPMQVAPLYFFARIAGPVPVGVFWRTTVAAVLMVLSRYLGDATSSTRRSAVLLSMAFWLYILGEAYFGANVQRCEGLAPDAARLFLDPADPHHRLGHLSRSCFFVETVIGAGHTRRIVLYTVADLVNLIVVAMIVLTVAGKESY